MSARTTRGVSSPPGTTRISANRSPRPLSAPRWRSSCKTDPAPADSRLAAQDGRELVAPKSQEALLIGTDAHQHQMVEAGVAVAANCRQMTAGVGAARDLLGHILGADPSCRGFEARGLGEIRHDLPGEQPEAK